MKNNVYTTHTLGYPRIGAQRQLKWTLEKFWRGEVNNTELESVASTLRKEHWKNQVEAGLDYVTANDFSLYDQVLDTACLFGIIPPRFQWDGSLIDHDLYFALARGNEVQPALAMTKWFDTNYHYLVPEVSDTTHFALQSQKILNEVKEAIALGHTPKPVLIGPVTLLSLSRKALTTDLEPISRVNDLIPLYASLLKSLHQLGCDWLQIDEPVLSTDLEDAQKHALETTYKSLAKFTERPKILLASYFGNLEDNYATVLDLPVDGHHVDAVTSSTDVHYLSHRYPANKVLSIGIIDGRNIWASNLKAKSEIIEAVAGSVAREQLWLAPSCSLLHVPYTTDNEDNIEPQLRPHLAFAQEKLEELRHLANSRICKDARQAIEKSAIRHFQRITAPFASKPAVRQQCKELNTAEFTDRIPFNQRFEAQQDQLPLYPTTTIGSFPQTAEIRAIRSQFKKGKIDLVSYDAKIEKHVKACVELQDKIGLDVLVHGEFERNDMVEFFADKIHGFAFSQLGWVQSYGSRCVKPPIIFGDVSRAESLSGPWIKRAQSYTKKPIKGMLSGPITMLKWSFVRDDVPLETVALQLAVTIREEVQELESNGISIIQVDEPALREALPLRKSHQAYYLKWAVDAFKLSTAGVLKSTQIHTHMCYGQFNEIFDAIVALDADVISIEATRNHLTVLDSFANSHYPNSIGIGVWDIHSPRVPTTESMVSLLKLSSELIDPKRVWVNPDCGLKTRAWPETIASLKNLVNAATQLRESHLAINN